ncbi:hypothetical protein EJ04DRAFT_21873 [Polyplosphaeria fusca]|uniref:Rhodopsin domain-containing protein n=1 Tax=Polyplosphaeria fusca TaxID=682080 RepID=A0A9P4QRA7_9PLEO|nr:hypothetical protein EJ04DRAFT_21873 [Polyplosphaeria fusca]
MSGAGEIEPLHRITKNDRGPILVIVAYSWIVVTTIVAIIRFTLAYNQRLRFKIDDATFLLGVVLAISSSVCVHIATNGGLGKHMNLVNESGLDKMYKALYSAELIGVAAMTAAKASVVFLSDRVAPRSPRPYYLMLVLVGVWSVFSTFAIAFQCGLPSPWVTAPPICPSAAALSYPIVILNLLTDFLLATWILPTLWKLLMETDKRVTVMVLFGSRLIVCCFEIVQLTSLGRHFRDDDITYEYFGRTLWGL